MQVVDVEELGSAIMPALAAFDFGSTKSHHWFVILFIMK